MGKYLGENGLSLLWERIITKLGEKANTSHNHSASNINSGTLSTARLPTVPINKGGTGEVTAAAALAALGGVSMTKLWENASPTSVFAAQTISVNLSNYDYVAVETDAAFIIKKKGLVFVLSTCSDAMYYRTITPNANGVTFGVCNRAASYGSWDTTDANGKIIPSAIYGIKGVQ